MDFLTDAGALGRVSAGQPDDLGADRMIGGVPAVAGEQPDGGFSPQGAQCSRRASSRFWLSMTSRSFRPLPPSTWITLRALSISVIFRRASSERRSPVAYSAINSMHWNGVGADSMRLFSSSRLRMHGR